MESVDPGISILVLIPFLNCQYKFPIFCVKRRFSFNFDRFRLINVGSEWCVHL